MTMLEGWRDGVRRHPTDAVVTEQEAAAALRAGVAGERRPEPQPRSRRGLTMVASMAAAVLCIGGFGAVVAGSGPGDSLYGLRTVLFGEKNVVRDDKVALAAQTEMAQVQQMIDKGDWDQAQQKLQAVSTQVQSVDDVTTKTDLIQQWNELSVKVGTRDANATLPPSSVGEPAVPPPAGVTLLELPAVTTSTATVTTSTEGATTTTSRGHHDVGGDHDVGRDHDSGRPRPGRPRRHRARPPPGRPRRCRPPARRPLRPRRRRPLRPRRRPLRPPPPPRPQRPPRPRRPLRPRRPPPTTTSTSAPTSAPTTTTTPAASRAATTTAATSAAPQAPATEESPVVVATTTTPAPAPRTQQQTTTTAEVSPAPAPAQQAPPTQQHQEELVTTTVPAPAG